MNLGKDRILRQIDVPTAVAAGEGEVIDSTPNTTPPSYAIAPTPTGLALTTGVNQSDRSATSWIEATCAAPYGTTPGQYIFQLATNSGFTTDVVTRVISAPPVGETPRYRFLGLKPGTVYYVRAACFFYEPGPYCDALPITSAQDTVAPSQPTSVTAALQTNGDLVVAGTSPSELNFARILITIRGVAAGPVYAVVEVPSTPGAAFRAVWTAAENVRQSGGGDASLVVEVQSQSWSGISSAALTFSPTKSAPSAPTASPTWNGAAGTCVFSFTQLPNLVYSLTIDGVAREVTSPYAYDLATNKSEHSGVADASLAWSLVATDPLNQTSPATSGTATLARPATPGSVSSDFSASNAVWSWAVVAGVSLYRLTIDGKDKDVTTLSYDYPFALNAQEHSGTADPSLTWSLVAVDALGQTSQTPASGTLVNAAPGAPTAISVVGGATGLFISITAPEAKDLRDYTVRIIKDGSDLETITSRVPLFAYAASAKGVFTVGVKVNDVFNQASSEYVTPSGTTVDPLIMAEHRAGAKYSDSGNVSGSFTDLSDDDRAAGGVVYAQLTTGWRWTQVDRQIEDVVKNVRIAATAGVGYIGVQKLDLSWAWFSGPLLADGVTLTAVVSESAAQSAAVSLPSDGLWVIPTLIRTRTVRLGHRRTSGGNYTLREYYPRRYSQLDDLDVEMIRGMRISGRQFIADELAAISASLGAVSISGVVDIGTNGGIWQGSAGSFASPTTGYKLYRSATGKGLWETWLAGVKQVYIDDAMAFNAAAGAIKLDASALTIAADNTSDTSGPTLLRWTRTNGTVVARLHAAYGGVSNLNRLAIEVPYASAGSTEQAEISLSPGPAAITGAGMLTLTRSASGSSSAVLSGGGRTLTLSNSGAVFSGAVTFGTLTSVGTAGTHNLGATSTDLYLTALSSAGSIYFGNSTANRATLDGSGNWLVAGGLYPSGNSSYYLAYSGTILGTRPGLFSNGDIQANGHLVSANDVYLGTRSTYLSSWLNQAVRTTDAPNFANLNLNGTGNLGIYHTIAGVGYRAFSGMYDNNTYGLFSNLTSAWPFKLLLSTNTFGLGADPGASNRVIINGLGTTNSTGGLLVRDSSNTANFQVLDNGACTYRTSMTQSSDARLKHDVRPLDQAEIDRLLAVRLVSYDRIGGDRRQRGVLAQELAEIYPELVYENPDGYLSVDYVGLTPLLLAKVQQLERRLAIVEAA